MFLQLILGAAFRHKGFGIIPHLIGAVIVTILIFMTAGALKRRFAQGAAAAKLRAILHILIGVQLLLGAGAYWSRLYWARFPQPIAVMVALTVVHTVTGALVLAVTLVTTLVTYRHIAGCERLPSCLARRASRRAGHSYEQTTGGSTG